MGIIKGLIFDGVDTHNYNIGLTGKDVYNAPERDVELVTIPGRNGDFALDKKRYKNIDITYHAGAYDNTQPDFSKKISDFKNELASRIGYKRLEDEYNVNEYRLAMFKSGLVIDPTSYQRAGEFDIVFSCKPQRYLKSGETEFSITDGQTVINPTPYEAQPLLMVTGYGDLSIEGQKMTLDNSIPLGDVVIFTGAYSVTGSLSVSLRPVLASGDTFTVTAIFSYSVLPITGTTFTSMSSSSDAVVVYHSNGGTVKTTKTQSFTFGTSNSVVKSQSVAIGYSSGGSTGTETLALRLDLAYDGDSTITFGLTTTSSTHAYSVPRVIETPDTIANSSKSSLGSPTYIDLEIGEAYKIDSGNLISLNNAVSLGAELPVLKPGANWIRFDNTITDLKMIPRWWVL